MALFILFPFGSAADLHPVYSPALLGKPQGSIIHLTSATDFCIFLPPNLNQSIALSEGYPYPLDNIPEEAKLFAVAHCTRKETTPQGARLLYDGFITGVEFKKTDQIISISGKIDATKALITMDGGGYFDLDMNVQSPPGGLCRDYDSFYNAINPIDGVFCLKCCKGIATCEIHKGGLGCSVMVPGPYTIGELPLTGRSIGSEGSSQAGESNQEGNPSSGGNGNGPAPNSKPGQKVSSATYNSFLYAALGCIIIFAL